MYKQDFILIDFETTGKTTSHGYEGIQVAAIRLDAVTMAEKAHFTSLIRPLNPGKVDPGAMNIHKISLETLALAPLPKDVAEALIKAIYKPEELEAASKTTMLAAYNAKFDWEFFVQLLERAGIERDKFGYHIFDFWTMVVDRCALLGVVPPGGKYSLQNLAELFNIERPEQHDALEDVRVAAEVMRRLNRWIETRMQGHVYQPDQPPRAAGDMGEHKGSIEAPVNASEGANAMKNMVAKSIIGRMRG